MGAHPAEYAFANVYYSPRISLVVQDVTLLDHILELGARI